MSEWKQVTVRGEIVELIDKAIKLVKDEFGILKYRSRSQFVETAIMNQIHIEEVVEEVKITDG